MQENAGVVELGIAGLVAAYVLVALLLLSINLYSRWPWWVKAGTIALTSAFYVITYFSFPPLLGWPTDAKLPERFRLIGAYVQEPNKATGVEGNIYLWATGIAEGSDPGEPRAYRLPYSSELHQKVSEATVKLRKGLAQLGETHQGKDASIQHPLDVSRGGQKSMDVEFYDLPDPLFPEK